MKWLRQLLKRSNPSTTRSRRLRRAVLLQRLENREVYAGDTLPVLMVVADQQDFYYREYAETRDAIEAQGLEVVVAATTTNPTYPHIGSGQAGSGEVQPDIALANVNADEYSAIVFVGGWGASSYQYAFNDPNFDGTIDNYYANDFYNGDSDLYDGVVAEQKSIVNALINDFIASDKYVAAICHGVTVLAWARVDGASPISGRNVAVPTTVSSPDQFYEGVWRNGGYMMGQYDQVIANGGIASAVSGNIGDPTTAADDVVVDGKIITAENYDSSYQFGLTIASEVLAGQPQDPLSPVLLVGTDLVIRGTDGPDLVYVWSTHDDSVGVWMNGISYGPFTLREGMNGNDAISLNGHVRVFGASGNDQIFATDLGWPATILGEEGNDLIVGGFVADALDGGDGVDRIWGGPGDDRIQGGSGSDFLYGREGNDVLVGDDGNDYLEGLDGNDILIGGLGSDYLVGNTGDDILIGGSTEYDQSIDALMALQEIWSGPETASDRVALLSNHANPFRLNRDRDGTIIDDESVDKLIGNAGSDWFFGDAGDMLRPNRTEDFVS